MNKKTFLLAAIIGVLIIPVLLTNMLLYANESKSRRVVILATVLPQRFIIVDENLTIKQVLSNTAEEIRPSVFLNSADGKEIPFSESIANQYAQIKPSLNFSHPGIVYKREERPVLALVKNFFRRFVWWGDV